MHVAALMLLVNTRDIYVIVAFNVLVKFMDVSPNLVSRVPFLGVFYVPWYAIEIRRNNDIVLSFI